VKKQDKKYTELCISALMFCTVPPKKKILNIGNKLLT